MTNLLIMKKLILLSIVAGMIIAFTSCSSVKFYSDEAMKVKTGFRFYTSRPYILVDHSSGKEKISVIWLPDLQNPQFLRIRYGIGSNDLKLAFKDGALTSFGLTTENDIDEMINSLASLISKGGALLTAPVPDTNPDDPGLFELYEIDVEENSTILRKVNLSLT